MDNNKTIAIIAVVGALLGVLLGWTLKPGDVTVNVEQDDLGRAVYSSADVFVEGAQLGDEIVRLDRDWETTNHV